jgi:hypothetical protein
MRNEKESHARDDPDSSDPLKHTISYSYLQDALIHSPTLYLSCPVSPQTQANGLVKMATDLR